MTVSPIELRRLAFIKYLYKLGLEQSQQPEPMNASSLLSFHDSIELFLQLTADHLQVTTTKDTKFLDYWDNTKSKLNSELTQKATVKRLNDARVGLKHYGRLPSNLDIEEYRVTSANFFKDNTQLVFDIDFETISLIDMISNPRVKTELTEGENLIKQNKIGSALQKIALSFEMLIDDYEKSKMGRYHKSPFFFGDDLTFESSFSLGIKDSRMAGFIDKSRRAIQAMQQALKILSLDLDYRRYSKFRLLTPKPIMISGGGYIFSPIKDENEHSLKDGQFCFDFVIDSAIRLQNFDYDVPRK